MEGYELGWYDYGARYYAPDLERWHAVDPLADEYHQLSPYNYTLNNPVLFIDPDGRIWDIVADVAFILYDVAEITYDYVTTGEVDPVSVAALTADVGMAFVPIGTGGGLAVRATSEGVEQAAKHSVKKVATETA